MYRYPRSNCNKTGILVLVIVYVFILVMNPFSKGSRFVSSFQPVAIRKHEASKRILQKRQRQWIYSSTTYFSTVMREQTRRSRGQLPNLSSRLLTHRKRTFDFAQRLYFARNQIKANKLEYAETIYRKMIGSMIEEHENGHSCDHSELAISTLLLALLLQRTNRVKETRSVFTRFFRFMHLKMRDSTEKLECTCTAKVSQAYALFEMKQGNTKKAYYLAKVAVSLDSDLKPLLNWKQFRNAAGEQ